MKKNAKRKGFTIVELVIVIAVIAILTTVLVPTFGNVINNAKDSAAKQEAKNAYTEYIADAAASGNVADYCVYEADANRFVAIANGAVVGVYETKEAALAAMVKNPTEDLVPTKNNKLFAYGGENVKESLAGKKISFLGDSITTYAGYSNNPAYNSTLLESRNPSYPNSYRKEHVPVADTWWMQTVENLGMKLCVNNAWDATHAAGSDATKSGCMDRTAQLHNDHTGEKPDIIVVYMGTNDAWGNRAVGTFTKLSEIYNEKTNAYFGNTDYFAIGYATMVHKIQQNYPDARIYLCTVDQYNPSNNGLYNRAAAYRDVIEYIADYFGCGLIDFYADTPITPDTLGTYTQDGCHPTIAGMNEMFKVVKEALLKDYTFEESAD